MRRTIAVIVGVAIAVGYMGWSPIQNEVGTLGIGLIGIGLGFVAFRLIDD